MSEMGRYCKAYPIQRLRAFPGWSEKSENTRKEKKEVDGQEVEAPRVLTDDTFLYLQENYTVTDGIYIDENIVFDNVSEEWKKFCSENLNFEIPVYEPVKIKATQDESDPSQEENG